MDWFFDMCIILFYAQDERENSIRVKKTLKFVREKGQKRFIVCFYIIENDLPKYIERQRIVIREVQRKIHDSSYVIGSTGEGTKLYPRDKSLAEKFYHMNITKTNQKPHEFIIILNEIQARIEQRIDFFMRTFIDEKVIPVKEIDVDLRSNLFTYIQNRSDANVIASGIQQHNIRELFLLTEDRTDWTKENLEWAMTPQLLKKYPKVPEIKYITMIS